MNRDSRLVYSTDGGRVREPKPPTRGQPAPRRDPDDGFVRLRREKAGRGGKTATTITGLPGADAQLEAALKELKQFLGTGGSRNGRVLELQGDHRDRLKAKLESMGYTVKIAGG
jgi:translation initiation factor 1